MVLASSTSRAGLPDSSSPSMRTKVNGSLGSSTEARTSASTRSRTRPASGPYNSTIGCAGLGLAMKRSMSEALMAVIYLVPPHPEEHREAMRLEGCGGPLDLGFTRDRYFKTRKSAIADLRRSRRRFAPPHHEAD